MTTFAVPHNLPAQLSSFIGREKEIAEVEQLLSRSRLVTLTGAGGSGKTRLALRVAEHVAGEFEHGAWFVDLAPVIDPSFVIPTIAQALGVREAAGRALLDNVRDFLRQRELLLFLDNFEQVVSAAPQVAALLTSSPELRVLI